MCEGPVKAPHVSHDSTDRKCDDTSKEMSSSDALINLEQGDPTMFEAYWTEMRDQVTMTVHGNENLSYFSSAKNLCWFLEPEFGEAIQKLHAVVGNAVTGNKFIVVGTGSTQLLQAALFALADPYDHLDEPVSVVCAAPFYSVTDIVRSRIYKWSGDASKYHKDGPYIELITSPNNPDGVIRGPVVANDESRNGMLIHDFAYLWPQYTPITAPADHDIMLFTLSKATGHAGSRIGWALVKDKKVAERMIHYITITSIGVSKEAQQRAATILRAMADHCGQKDDFFQHSQCRLNKRWTRMRDVVDHSNIFTLKDYDSDYCTFFNNTLKPNPAFAWLSCDHIQDLSKFFLGLKIRTRGGTVFGVDPKYVRVSMVGRDDEFDVFLERLASVNKDDQMTRNFYNGPLGSF